MAMILSAAMMLRHSFGREAEARGSRQPWPRRWPTASRAPTSAAVPALPQSARRCSPGSEAAQRFIDIYHISAEAMDMTHAALADAVEAADRPLELAIVLPTLNEKANIAPMVAAARSGARAERLGSGVRRRQFEGRHRRGGAPHRPDRPAHPRDPAHRPPRPRQRRDRGHVRHRRALCRGDGCRPPARSRAAARHARRGEVGRIRSRLCQPLCRRRQRRGSFQQRARERVEVRQRTRPQADRHRTDRRDERVFPASRRAAAQPGRPPVRHRFQDHARHPRHGRAQAPRKGIPVEIRPTRRR